MPNYSLSSSPAGEVVQFTVTRARARRSLALWTARATVWVGEVHHDAGEELVGVHWRRRGVSLEAKLGAGSIGDVCACSSTARGCGQAGKECQHDGTAVKLKPELLGWDCRVHGGGTYRNPGPPVR